VFDELKTKNNYYLNEIKILNLKNDKELSLNPKKDIIINFKNENL
jgi:hypothetical protein